MKTCRDNIGPLILSVHMNLKMKYRKASLSVLIIFVIIYVYSVSFYISELAWMQHWTFPTSTWCQKQQHAGLLVMANKLVRPVCGIMSVVWKYFQMCPKDIKFAVWNDCKVLVMWRRNKASAFNTSNLISRLQKNHAELQATFVWISDVSISFTTDIWSSSYSQVKMFNLS